MRDRKLEDMTFEEMVNHAALEIHTALLEGGGKSFKGRLHVWMGQAIYWSEAQDKKVKKGKKK